MRASPMLGISQEARTKSLSAICLGDSKGLDVHQVGRAGDAAIQHNVSHQAATENARRLPRSEPLTEQTPVVRRRAAADREPCVQDDHAGHLSAKVAYARVRQREMAGSVERVKQCDDLRLASMAERAVIEGGEGSREYLRDGPRVTEFGVSKDRQLTR